MNRTLTIAQPDLVAAGDKPTQGWPKATIAQPDLIATGDKPTEQWPKANQHTELRQHKTHSVGKRSLACAHYQGDKRRY